MTSHHGTTPEALLGRGEALLQQGDYAAAMDIFQTILRSRPDFAPALCDAALVCTQLGLVGQAERLLQRALEVAPDYEIAFFNLLDLYLQVGGLREAREWFVRCSPDIPPSTEKDQYAALLLRAVDMGLPASLDVVQKPVPAVPSMESSAEASGARNLIVTGIPRSGTSLLSVLINQLDGAVCLNEILYDVARLDEGFAEIRRRLVAGEPIPNKYDASGKLTSNTWVDGGEVEERSMGRFAPDVVIGSKVTLPYLQRLPELVSRGYKVVALVRDPLYTLGSWNRPKLASSYVARVTDDDRHPHWRGFAFQGTTRLERQAEVWQHLASVLMQHRDQIRLYRYEDLVTNTAEVLTDLCHYLEIEPPAEMPVLDSQNTAQRYTCDIAEVRAAVQQFAPLSMAFGYDPYEPAAASGDGQATEAPPTPSPFAASPQGARHTSA